MKALLYSEFGGPIQVTEVPDPAPPADGVLVRVEASGLCRSDWHAWAGHDDTVTLPHVPGHEFAGVVAAVGAEVSTARVGDRVTAPFVNGCGRCEWCRAGQAQICANQTQPGFDVWGSHAQFVTVRAADVNLVRLPDDLGFDAAASLGCRFATAFHALTQRAGVTAGEWVAVHGAGGVGLSTIMIAAALGARPIAVDRSPAALQLATQLGAEHTIVAGDDDDIPATVAALTGGGAQVSVDAVGARTTSVNSVLSLRRRGRHVQVGLFADGVPTLPLERVLTWELSVLGSHGMAAVDYPDMLRLVSSGRLRPQDLVTSVVDLETAARLIPVTTTADSKAPGGITVLHP